MGKASRAKRERRGAPPSPVAGRPPARRHLLAAALIIALLVAGGAAWLASGGDKAATRTGVAAVPGLRRGLAPWPPEQQQLAARLDKIGVPFSNMEGTALHFHPRLAVFVAGRQVEVPANIGISTAEQKMAALHTHDASGTIHVESPQVRDYTLGEFFDVWGVRFTQRCLGGYCAGNGKHLRVFADGAAVASLRALKLRDNQQILVAYGTPVQIKQALGQGCGAGLYGPC